MYPLDVGAVRGGYLFASLSDPYGFYRGNSIALTLKIFAPVIGGIILLWFAWLYASRRFILRPYLLSLLDLEKKQALWKLAAQLGHDIRSPLAAMRRVVNQPS